MMMNPDSLWLLALALVAAGVALNVALRISYGSEATISHHAQGGD